MSATTIDRATGQRRTALNNGNLIRVLRRDFKLQLIARERDIEDAIREPEWWLLSAKVFDVLTWAPKIGARKAEWVLRRAEVWPLRELGRLTVRQRMRVLAEVQKLHVPPPPPSRVKIPAAPFREWVEARMPEFESRAALRRRLGVSDRALGRILAGQEVVTLELVDRSCTALGWHLSELYPELQEAG